MKRVFVDANIISVIIAFKYELVVILKKNFFSAPPSAVKFAEILIKELRDPSPPRGRE